MKHYNSSNLINSLKEDSVLLLEQIEQIVNHTPIELLESNDGPGRWNTLQVLEHLNSYYRYYIPKMTELVEKSVTAPSVFFTPGLLGGYFTRSMMPKDGVVKNKMKAMKGHSPNAQLNSENVLSEFLQWQRKLILLIGKAENIDLNAIRVPVSIAPYLKLKLGDMLMFIVAHNKRHWVQIEKLLERYPAHQSI
ncbi:DinB family protein [Flavihumibacter sp.]|uniref:DinB family protein n=1 Tax=Flavihumibacter sp. TaxID=1913981 RepID=UPI002FCA3112